MDKGTPQTHPSDEWVAFERLTENIALRNRIRELEAEVEELRTANAAFHQQGWRDCMSVMQPRAEAAEDKLRAVRELPRHRMDIIDGNYYPVVDQKRGSWVRANELEALLLNEPRSRPIQGGWQQKNTMTGEVTEPPLQRHE